MSEKARESSASARAQIMAGIRRSHLRGPLDSAARAAIDARLARHPRGLQPGRTDLDQAGLMRLFEVQATEAAATVHHVAHWGDVAAEVAGYLSSLNLPATVKVAPDPDLDAAGWQDTTLTVERGRGEETDAVGVTGCFAAIAETGTLMMLSGPGRPTTLNFLPDTHIAIVARDRIVAGYEDGWDRMRAAGAVPRSVNFITGPSRTGDIEQKLQMGAHGPRRLHIIVVDTPSPS
ncbi:lactate utilization protein [Fodinicurvata sp. EGI_FJ10296]|uniref:LutC/YkgG family protein n=1 Tax=Fodinicurvata sp. EGI_FJ10296 TaxID=3231908 RepID=UPI003455137B